MSEKKTTPLQMAVFFLQGVLIGTGAILPGISGGVLCVAFGVYEPVMAFLSHPVKTFRAQWRMFVPILLGGAAGFVLLAKVVEWFLSASPVAAMALFAGLICGTVPALFRASIDSETPGKQGLQKSWAPFVLALAGSYALFSALETGMEGSLEPNAAWFLFCGVIWGLSMIVPGLSSSSILLFMGLYEPMTRGIGNLDLAVLLPLGAGFLATVLALARLVNYVLEKYYPVFSRLILGFVLSSVVMILPVSFGGAGDVAVAAGCFAAGFAAAMAMDRAKAKNAVE